jgi:hypothetical protein
MNDDPMEFWKNVLFKSGRSDGKEIEMEACPVCKKYVAKGTVCCDLTQKGQLIDKVV